MTSTYFNKTRRLAALGTLGLTMAACSAGGGSSSSSGKSGNGTGGNGGGSASNGGNGPILLVPPGDYQQVEQDFWQPPPFKGTGCTGVPGYWAEAVQKSLWFFHVNKSGPGVTHTYVQWRGDSHLEDAKIELVPDSPTGVNMSQEFIDANRDILDPDGDGYLDMSGGFYDAGDFIKIGITSNYAAHTLGWMMWEYPSAFKNLGLEKEALNILKWHGDFFLKNTYVDQHGVADDPWQWDLVAYGHQVGTNTDHECGWMPPELRRTSFCPRQGFFATPENPAADVTAGAAAALALIGWLHKDVDPDYATECLNKAIVLYKFAKANPDTKWSVQGGLYESEYAYDDIAWAAIWLHEVLPDPNQAGATAQTALYASHKQAYLDDIIGTNGATSVLDSMPGFAMSTCKEAPTSCWVESWTHIWNSLRSGVFLKTAEILSRYGSKYGNLALAMQATARKDSLDWVVGPKTAGGFSKKVDVSWGSGRYNSAGQMVALAYAKMFPSDTVPDDAGYTAAGIANLNTASVITTWAKAQSEYLLGANPLGQSYMMGFGDSYASNAHHAATHASIYGLCDNPEESKHIAWGALVSGPNAGDSHSEDRCDYGANEITIDYNGAFFGALAGNYAFNGAGQCPLTNFPPIEPPFDEYYTKGKLNIDPVGCKAQIEITLVNETAHPPRYNTNLSVRYYLDTTELQAVGVDPNDIKASIIYENWSAEGFTTKLSKLLPCTLNTSTWYFEMKHPYEFWGEQVKLHGPRTLILEISLPDGSKGCNAWDGSNDFSFAPLTNTVAKSPNIPAYTLDEGADEPRLVWGAQPECNEPPKVVVPPPVIR
jgi:endoglucanase